MKNFYYICKNNNQTQCGYTCATSIQSAARNLQQAGYTIVQLKEIVDNSNLNLNATVLPFDIKEKKEFFNSLYFQYKAGLPIVETFEYIGNVSSNKNVKIVSLNISKKLKEGQSFKNLMEHYANIIGTENAALLAAGEKSGKLYETAYGILGNVKKEEEVKSSLIKGAIYPCLILGLSLFAFMMTKLFIVPQLMSMNNITPCNPIVALIKAIFLSTATLVAIYYIFKFLFSNRRLRNAIQNFISKLSILEEIFTNYYLTILFRVIALAYNSGHTVPQAIELAAPVLNNKELKTNLLNSAKMIENGTNVETAMEISGLFDQFTLSQIDTASKSGEYDKVFLLLSENTENKMNIAIEYAKNVFNITALIIVAIVVGLCLFFFYTNYYNNLLNSF